MQTLTLTYPDSDRKNAPKILINLKGFSKNYPNYEQDPDETEEERAARRKNQAEANKIFDRLLDPRTDFEKMSDVDKEY